MGDKPIPPFFFFFGYNKGIPVVFVKLTKPLRPIRLLSCVMCAELILSMHVLFPLIVTRIHRLQSLRLW